MIGVVIWSSEASRKAVIWCEDQGPLAYLRGCDSLLDQVDWPVPGDLLRLECETIGNLRHARAVSVIAPKVCPQLPDALLGQIAERQREVTRIELEMNQRIAVLKENAKADRELKKAGITVCENMLCCAAYVITDTHCPHCGTSKIATQPE